MFGINGGEFFLIGIVALLVLGPERLPVLARKAGRWTREMRAIATEFRTGLERELGGNPIQEFKDEVAKPASEFRSVVTDIRDDFNATGKEISKDIERATSDNALEWTGPVSDQGPTPEDAAEDLARIEAGEDLLADRGPVKADGDLSLDEIDLGADLDD